MNVQLLSVILVQFLHYCVWFDNRRRHILIIEEKLKYTLILKNKLVPSEIDIKKRYKNRP